MVHPLDGRKIPIITDAELVDMSFGTGAVKITPAHDPNDFATGKRHGLQFMNILTNEGNINAAGGQFAGQPRFKVRSPDCLPKCPAHTCRGHLLKASGAFYAGAIFGVTPECPDSFVWHQWGMTLTCRCLCTCDEQNWLCTCSQLQFTSPMERECSQHCSHH